MYLSFVTHLPEDGHMSGRNMWGVYGVCNIPTYTYVRLLVLITDVAGCGDVHCTAVMCRTEDV